MTSTIRTVKHHIPHLYRVRKDFDMGDGSTSCTILTTGYDVDGMAREFLDRNKLLGWNSWKYFQMCPDRI